MDYQYVIKNIPFYEGENVQSVFGGRLRGRGSRTFKRPISPYGYQYNKLALFQSLPKHLAENFTLYAPVKNSINVKIYCEFKSFKNGKLHLSLINS